MKILRCIRMPLICMAVAPTAFGACRIGQIAEIPVAVIGNRLLIDGQINSQPVKIFVDTGAEWTIVWEDAATRLGLPLDTDTRMRFYGAGGEARVLGTVIKQFQMGMFSDTQLHLAVIGPASGAKRRSVAQRSDMVLGEDFLSNFTTEFDLAHGLIRFLRPQGCALDQLTYWSDTYSMAELRPLNPQHPRLDTDVIVNGKRIEAMLDTGAQSSLTTRHAAASVGVIAGQGSAVRHGAITGVAGVPHEAWSGSFDTFSIGDESMRNVKLTIADLFTGDAEVKTGSRIAQPIEGLPSMVVGCDFFLSHRILISPKEHKLLFTYNGGPVFRFVEGTAPKSETEHADGSPGPAASAPKPH